MRKLCKNMVCIDICAKLSMICSPLVKKLPIGDFECGMGVFRIEDWVFRKEDWRKINIGKTPIPN